MGRSGVDRIVALGGDGTIHEVVNGMMALPAERRPELGVVPVGSGNDFCFSLGVSMKPEESLQQALELPALPMDVGWLRDNLGNSRYFVNVVGVGFDAVINAHSRTMPILRGFLMYLACTLKAILLNYTRFRLSGKRDDAEWQDTYMMYVVCNGRREGGGFHVAPGALLDDGKFHSVAVTPISRPVMLATLPHFMKGTQFQLGYVKDGSFRDTEFSSDVPMPFHVDGELCAGLDSVINHLEIKNLPGVLRVVQVK
jgi:YegS/Rv2252/BmrU family lipid kinase